MMGRLERGQGQLFYSFCHDEAVPADHRARESRFAAYMVCI